MRGVSLLALLAALVALTSAASTAKDVAAKYKLILGDKSRDCNGTPCPNGCCPEQNWFCCADGYFCASTEANCPQTKVTAKMIPSSGSYSQLEHL